MEGSSREVVFETLHSEYPMEATTLAAASLIAIGWSITMATDKTPRKRNRSLGFAAVFQAISSSEHTYLRQIRLKYVKLSDKVPEF